MTDRIHIFKKLVLFLLLLGFYSCNNKEFKLNEDYVVQIDDIGLREGVFERRFKLTKDFSAHKSFTANSLKNSIDNIFLPDLLFIRKAYELGFDKDPSIKKNNFEFKVNALASTHPINSKSIFISDKELKDFYEEKDVLYTFQIIQHNSFWAIDSISKNPNWGKNNNSNVKEKRKVMPRELSLGKRSYGQSVPIEVYKELKKIKVGESTKPIYIAPTWNIIRLIAKEDNKKLTSFAKLKRTLVKEFEIIGKQKQIIEFQDSLLKKYKIEKVDINYSKILNSFVTKNGIGFFQQDKYKGNLKNDLVITSNKGNITVDDFFYFFNKGNQFAIFNQITKEDVQVFIDDLTKHYALYLDHNSMNYGENKILVDQIENKSNKLLLQKFIRDEITRKVKVSEDEARDHYNNNRKIWVGEFDKVKRSIISELRDKKIKELRESLIEQYKEKYNVVYNNELIKQLAEKYTKEKNN